MLVGAIIIIYAGYRGWWIWGWQHKQIVDELKRERDVYRTLALKGTKLAELLVGLPPGSNQQDNMNDRP